MASTINTNITSINAQRNLNYSGQSLNTTMARLSSGLRVNSAKDDAAGMAIADRMNTQVRGLQVASRNANDGISLAQTAEGALGRIGDMLQRARELAVQAANTTNSAGDRKSLQAEVAQIIAEVDRVAKQTNFNGQKILDGSFAGAVFQVAAMSGDNVTVGSLADTRSAQIGNISYATNPLALDVRDSAGPPMLRAIAKFDERVPAGTLKITVGTNDPVQLEFLEPANSSVERMGQVVTAINNKSADTGVTAYLTMQPGTQTYDIALMSSKLDKKGEPLPVKFEGFTQETTGLTFKGWAEEARVAASTEYKALMGKIDSFTAALGLGDKIETSVKAIASPEQLKSKITAALGDVTQGLGKAVKEAKDENPTSKTKAEAVNTALEGLITTVKTDIAKSGADYEKISTYSAANDVAAVKTAYTAFINTNETLKAIAPTDPVSPLVDPLDQGKLDVLKAEVDGYVAQADAQNKAAAIPAGLAELLGKGTEETKDTIDAAAKAVLDHATITATSGPLKEYKDAADALGTPPTAVQLNKLASTLKTAKAEEQQKAIEQDTERVAYQQAVRDNDWTAAKAADELTKLNTYGQELATRITSLRKEQLQAAYDAEAARTGATPTTVGDDHPRLNKYVFPTDYETSTLEDARREIARMEALAGVTGLDITASHRKMDQRGIDDVNVATQEGAWIALKKIDSALDQVNMARGTLGALQTRFENTVNNIDIQVENLAAARGRIIDADFAKETANLSRTQVLQQAGTTMVAQANQIPQRVLELLK